jgi:hypothetical protein
MSENLELEQRFLCADGACIGLVGADGRCRTCGSALSPHDVAEFERATGTTLGPEFERASLSEPSEGASGSAEQHVWTATPDEPPDLEDRVLCADGRCIGVIGPSGSCKACGKPADWTDDGGSVDATEDGGSAPDATEDGGSAPDATEDGGSAPDATEAEGVTHDGDEADGGRDSSR